MRIVHVVAARPNYMKIAPVMRAVARAGFAEQVLVHTGQHYDPSMSEIFFTDLGMAPPDVHLGVGSGTHAEQTGRVMIGFEKICMERRPDLVLVAGDVNSTLACAIAAAKLQIPSAHLEAGLRSFDMSMPEEVNRIVVDRIARILLTPSADADENLRREGTAEDRIFPVGNVMIDTLLGYLEAAKATGTPRRLGLEGRRYVALTLHRPSNVDDPVVLGRILGALEEIQRDATIVFPIHPRTRKQLASFGLAGRVAAMPDLRLCDPLGYLEFLGLMAGAALVVTDSGGLQEESTALGIPCLTLRENTERPVTVTEGTNTVVGTDPVRIVAEARRALSGTGKAGRIPALWDGRASERVAEVLRRFM
jgi:UDP-N-acetylglucosamine 2-epimerase (non-hydrolysing)